MKRIRMIAICLLASLAWGQQQNFPINFHADSCKSNIRWDLIEKWDWPKEYLVIGLVFLWDQYSKECYADSMVKNFFKPLFDGDNEYYLPEFTYEKWIHKQPSFPDFILWLKKKVGVGMKKDSVSYIREKFDFDKCYPDHPAIGIHSNLGQPKDKIYIIRQEKQKTGVK